MTENKNLEVIIQESGIEKTEAMKMYDHFQSFLQEISLIENEAKSIKINDVSEKQSMKRAREIRLILKNVRTNSEKVHKDMKAGVLRQGRFIDGLLNMVKYLVVPLEEHLMQQEKFAENKEIERIKAVVAERSISLQQYGVDPQFYNLAEMPEELFQKLFRDSKELFEKREREEADRIEQERIAEEKRIEQEKAEAEERKKKEAEAEKERQKELADEREKARVAEEARIKAETEAEDLRKKAEAERIERERIENEQREKDRLEQERIAEEARKKAEADKEEAERLLKLEQAPDVEKLKEFANSGDLKGAIDSIVYMKLSTEYGSKVQKQVEEMLSDVQKFINKNC